MWFRFCVIVVLLSTNLAKHDPKGPNEGNKEDAEAIFASVIKNISRVNNVLQELISNYEHLQKIYKSQENIQSESSDGEIDDVYKSKRNRVGLEMPENETPTTERADGYPATQIIWSDNDNEGGEDSGNDSSDSAEASNVTEYESLEKLSPTPSEPAELNKAEIIFVDSQKPNVKKKRKPTADSVLAISEAPKTIKKSQLPTLDLTIKTEQKHKKKEKKHHSTEAPTKKAETSKSDSKTTPSDVESKKNDEKKLHSELFSPKKIWGEIISNKPIQLEVHSELALEKLRKDINDESTEPALRQRSKHDTEAVLVNVTYKNQTEATKRKVSGSSEGLEEEDREEFQATVLREAYGDACMKVVIRKCFKACKAAGKSICDRYKCKSNYKQKFTEFIKVGCLREFQGNTTEKSVESFRAENVPDDKDSDMSIDPSRRDGETRLTDKSSNITSQEKKEDTMTWNKYLRSCLPHIQAGSRHFGKPSEDTHNAAISLSPDNLLPNLNVLRDKYERACQKISKEKCNKACKYGYTKVCESFTCKSARKKAYKKQCRLKCKSAYRTRYNDPGHSKDSDSDSDSDSSGSSDSSTRNSS